MTVWKCLVLSLFVFYIWMAAADGTLAKEDKSEIKKGDESPRPSRATDDQGKTWKSSDHVGKKVIVVYFYPADFTGGCTKQACTYRDNMDKLTEGHHGRRHQRRSAKTHELFKKHHKLNFTLLADEKGDIAKKFGVTVRIGGKAEGIDEDGKKINVEDGVTILRWTFVIGKDGTILYKNDKVTPRRTANRSSKRLRRASNTSSGPSQFNRGVNRARSVSEGRPRSGCGLCLHHD